jgi:hypothetical protein
MPVKPIALRLLRWYCVSTQVRIGTALVLSVAHTLTLYHHLTCVLSIIRTLHTLLYRGCEHRDVSDINAGQEECK